jgi:tRNA-specific 2-thiouridylase
VGGKDRVAVGMSGGVDSAVAAVLLQEQGYEVIGVTHRYWSPPSELGYDIEGGCCSLAAVEDARRVCYRLGIPFYVFNLADEFKTRVVDDFVESYRAGLTPNPCVNCNRFIKWDLFFNRAAAGLGADYIASGHYAGVRWSAEHNRHLLIKAIDTRKDQSYALYSLSAETLAHILLPLANLTKPEVRDIARQHQLAVAEKEESQEICFIPDNDYRRFLRDYGGVEGKPGPIVTADGLALGRHSGLFNYTVGQRSGLGLSGPEPYYVLKLDTNKNALVVGNRNQLETGELTATVLQMAYWPPDGKITAKVRYRAKDVPCTAEIEGETLRVRFEGPVGAITPGQTVVLYDGDVALGGGPIKPY